MITDDNIGRRSPLSYDMGEYSPDSKPRRDTFSPEPGTILNHIFILS